MTLKYDGSSCTGTGTAGTSNSGNLIGLWEFNETSAKDPVQDTGLGDGIAQNGTYDQGATPQSGWLTLDGEDDHVDIDGCDTPFDLASGTIETAFVADASSGNCGSGGLEGGTLVSRGEYADRDTEGYFGISTTAAGAIMVEHYAGGNATTLSTVDGFFSAGHEVKVAYGWDASAGVALIVQNVTTGQTVTLVDDAVTGLTMDIGDNDDENFTFGAREEDDGSYGNAFDGAIAYVAVYDQAALPGDGLVEGSAGDDLIDAAYTGDPEGDMIDAGDAILPGEAPDDDIVLAGAGSDTILSGEGDDEIYAGTGNDVVDSGTGDDLVYGGGGDDTVEGGTGDDTIYGDGGNEPTIATITFEAEEAGYLNTLGVYTIDPDTGAIGNVEIAFENSSAIGSGGDLSAGDSYTYVTDPGSEVGVFLISQGFSQNDYSALGAGTLEFRDANGDQATVDTTNPTLVHVAEDGTETALYGDIYHTAAHGGNEALNADGLLHTAGFGENADGSVTLGFEDIYNLGDQDYDDPIFTVSVEGAGSSFNNAHYDVGTPADPLDDGDDVLFGDEGADEIHGGGGDDEITGGDGADTLYGGADQDTFLGGDVGEVVDGGDGGIDWDVLDLRGSADPNGGLRVNITGPDSDGNGFDGTVDYLDAGGTVTGSMTFENIEKIIPCFTPGTLIATPRGERPVDALRAGDKVITRDNGIQEIRWIGATPVETGGLAKRDHLTPILIRAGALGHGLPERDMLVSPQHRVLVANDRTALYFEEREVLVAAKHLVNNRSIQRVTPKALTYVHFMFDQHEVVLSNGAWTESFQPGDYTLGGMGNAQRNEIFELFPELQTEGGLRDYVAARKTLKKHEAVLLTDL